MEFTQQAFDQLVYYTLRIELPNGKVLIYPVDAGNKHYVSNKLWRYADGREGNPPFPFLWFQTVKNRHVLVATGSISRVSICSDLREHVRKEPRYNDNFNLLGKAPVLEEWESGEGESEIIVFGDDPPQVLIYLKGQPPEDGYSKNPLTYTELEEACLGALHPELEGDCPLRPFFFLTDDDGEENFVATAQIMVMEFDNNLLYEGEDPFAMEEEEEEALEEAADDDAIAWDEPTEEKKQKRDDLPF